MPAHLTYQRTRYAPTPSGFLHLGNIVSFVLTAGLARKYGATILLRIDDLDRERVRTEYLEDIFETLRFLELPWDEGPRSVQEHQALYAQQTRTHLYAATLQQLQQQQLFACACSRSQLVVHAAEAGYPGHCLHRQLPLNAPGVAWRMKTPAAGTLAMHLADASSATFFFPSSMQGFMVRGKNGTAAYQLASVVDDVHFGVDLIIRGADLLPASLAQLYLAGCLSGLSPFRQAAFFHHPLLRTANGAKLSKSAGATSVHYLRRQGNTAADVFTQAAALCGVQQRIDTWQQLFGCLPVADWLAQPR